MLMDLILTENAAVLYEGECVYIQVVGIILI